MCKKPVNHKMFPVVHSVGSKRRLPNPSPFTSRCIVEADPVKREKPSALAPI
jgi:hypothetical protein